MSFSRAETTPIATSVTPPKPVFQLHEGNFFESEGIGRTIRRFTVGLWIPRVAQTDWYQAIIATHAASAPQLVAPKLIGAFFANIDVHLWHFIRRSDCSDLRCDLQSREQPGRGHPQAQAGTFASKA
jgi:hypothetical protein